MKKPERPKKVVSPTRRDKIPKPVAIMEKIVCHMVMFDKLGLIKVSSIHTCPDKLINFRNERAMCRGYLIF